MLTSACPYCPKPLPDRPGAVTCGTRACQKQHHQTLSREWYRANRDHVLAQKKSANLCQFCGAGITSGKTCSRSECRKAYHTLWRHAVRDATPVKFDLSAEQIERKLASLSSHRRTTRSWLRIEDPWAQKTGSELHKRVDVTTYDLEGAMQ